MAFLYNKISRRVLLALITMWGIVSFWQLSPLFTIKLIIVVLGVLSLAFIWFEVAPLFLLIFLSFIASYSFYGFLFQYNLPIWLIMVGLAVIFGYIYLYVEQKIGILGNSRLIYLVLFVLITLEVFLSISYFPINPLSKSLIIGVVSYLFIGFIYTVLAKHEKSIRSYVLIALFMIILIFTTSSWGGSI